MDGEAANHPTDGASEASPSLRRNRHAQPAKPCLLPRGLPLRCSRKRLPTPHAASPQRRATKKCVDRRKAHSGQAGSPASYTDDKSGGRTADRRGERPPDSPRCLPTFAVPLQRRGMADERYPGCSRHASLRPRTHSTWRYSPWQVGSLPARRHPGRWQTTRGRQCSASIRPASPSTKHAAG
jgi:hypothetical protein